MNQANKPLLIIPPSPGRWPGVELLLGFLAESRLDDLRRRVCQPAAGAGDAVAIIASGSLVLACACIRRSGPVGVLGDLFTRPDHRLRGMARSLLQTLLSWFDMTGGKRLYLTSPADLAIAIFDHFGFEPLHRVAGEPFSTVTMLRTPFDESRSPLAGVDGEARLREVTRADYPAMFELLQHRDGADPRVPRAESAAAADATIIELLAQQERNACRLLNIEQSGLMTGCASVAVDQLGKRTFAMLMPHSLDLPGLREGVRQLAAARGYESVDYPLEALGSAAQLAS